MKIFQTTVFLVIIFDGKGIVNDFDCSLRRCHTRRSLSTGGTIDFNSFSSCQTENLMLMFADSKNCAEEAMDSFVSCIFRMDIIDGNRKKHQLTIILITSGILLTCSIKVVCSLCKVRQILSQSVNTPLEVQ